MSKSATNKPKFKIGESVYLKSGSPEMSVYEPIEFGGTFTGDYYCQWFAGKKLEKGRFAEESLTSTNPKP